MTLERLSQSTYMFTEIEQDNSDDILKPSTFMFNNTEK